MSEQGDLLAPAQGKAARFVCSTEHARSLLRKRFPTPEWALMEEVAPATGGGTTYADAVAVNLWSSRGHAVHGFEIKISRSDWLRELKQPAKAEGVFSYCDHWWLVAPRDIVKDGELPLSWGWLEVREASMVQVKAAPKLEPKALTRAFFASLMRRGHEQITGIAERMQREAVAEARAAIDKRVQADVAVATKHHEKLKKAVEQFHAETGLQIGESWAGPPHEVIKLAQKLEHMRGYGRHGPFGAVIELANQLDRYAEQIHKAIADSGLGPEQPPAA